MGEAAYHDLVAAWLREAFVDVVHEPMLPTGREPDFFVSTPWRDYVIEVEDTAESLYTGLGQALVYAAETDAIPVTVFPADSGVEPGRYGSVHVETV